MFLALTYATIAGLVLRGKSSTPFDRSRALGVNAAAIGTAIALASGLLSDSFLKSSSIFQQVRFASYYAGFALITFGLDAIVRTSQQTHSLPRFLSITRYSSFLIWGLFSVALVIAIYYLVNPATFIHNQYGFQVQRVVYWFPMLMTTFTGAVLIFLVASGMEIISERSHLIWIGAFAAFVFVGLLKESLIIPGLGNPLTDLLAAFVPFVIGTLCLCFRARNLLISDGKGLRMEDSR
jgi:hypothetical protein